MNLYIKSMVWVPTGVCYIIDSAGLKLRVNNYLLKEGDGYTGGWMEANFSEDYVR